MVNREGITPVISQYAPPPGGHYSQAILHGGLIYISGQLPLRVKGDGVIGEAFEGQARQALSNLLSVLEAAGGGPESLLKVTAYIVGVEKWPIFNRIYAEMLGDIRPARSIIPVPELHHGSLVEIDAVAAQIRPVG
jgi:reactive intermediate/imine deaminase